VVGTGVLNAESGVIDAVGSQVVLAAGDLYSLAIRHGGALQAGDLTMQVQASGQPPQNEEIQLDSDVAADGTALFDGDVRIGIDASGDGVVEIDAGDEAVFTSTVDSLAGQQNDLRVDAPLSRFEDNVGTLDALDTLQLTGDALKSTPGDLSIVANMVEFNADDQSGTVDADQEARVDQGYLDIDANVRKSTAGSLTLIGNASAGSDIRLQGETIETTDGDLILDGSTDFDGPAGGTQTAEAGSTGEGVLTIKGDVTKSETGTLKLIGTDGIDVFGRVDGDFDLEIHSGGDAIFRGNIGELEALASFATFVVFNPDTGEGVLIFDGDDFLIRVVGDITFNEELGFVPTVATVGATGDLTISSTSGSFAMGRRQKLTVDGDLLVGGALDGSLPLGSTPLLRATLSDISTLGAMIINASQIFILAREPGQVEAPVGGETVLLPDQGVDFVAGGKFFFSVTPGVKFGGSQAVQFANPDGEGDALGTLKAFTMRAFGTAVTSEMLRAGRSELASETFFDLRAQGPTNTNPGEALAGAVPLEPTEVAQDLILGANERRELFERLSIMARELEPADLAPLPGGRALWIDYGNPTIIDPSLLLTVVARLQPYLAGEALRLYGELIEAGQGNPRNIADVLEYAYDDYVGDRGSGADPAQFGIYLAAAPDQAEARGYLEMLARLHGLMATLGLTEAELGRPIARFCDDFRPSNIQSCGVFILALKGAVPATPPAAGEISPADEWSGGDQDFSQSPQPPSAVGID
jgi:hypothetical protein